MTGYALLEESPSSCKKPMPKGRSEIAFARTWPAIEIQAAISFMTSISLILKAVKSGGKR